MRRHSVQSGETDDGSRVQKWGESGYFRIKRGDNKCGINSQAITAVL
jgi:hypothetical protein